MPLPPLRHVEAVPIEYEGQRYICVQDPAGLAEGQMLLSPLAYFAAFQLDGVREAEDILSEIESQYGPVEITRDDVLGIVGELDSKGFLYSETYDELYVRATDTYRQLESREAYLAAKAYPEDPQELRDYLNGLFTREGGPGRLPNGDSGAGEPLTGIVVPHIDYERGGHAYAHGYLRLHEAGAPDTVLLFGVAHMAEPVPFILTRHDFETPLGTVRVDREALADLECVCDWDPYQHELTHRTEHSIELQAVMLAHLFGDKVEIVPILCSDFDHGDATAVPGGTPSIERFLDACRTLIEREDKKVSVIASADLAHVGKRFGDPFDIDDAIVEGVRGRDEEDLAFVHRIDAAGFYESVMKDDNERKVCGLNCIYSALRSVAGASKESEALHYGYAPDPLGGIVSFATIALK